MGRGLRGRPTGPALRPPPGTTGGITGRTSEAVTTTTPAPAGPSPRATVNSRRSAQRCLNTNTWKSAPMRRICVRRGLEPPPVAYPRRTGMHAPDPMLFAAVVKRLRRWRSRWSARPGGEGCTRRRYRGGSTGLPSRSPAGTETRRTPIARCPTAKHARTAYMLQLTEGPRRHGGGGPDHRTLDCVSRKPVVRILSSRPADPSAGSRAGESRSSWSRTFVEADQPS